MDRIFEAMMLKEEFERPAGLDSPRALLNAVADTPGDGWSVEVLLETAAEVASWQLPSVGFALEQTEGGTLLRCSTSDLGWMGRVLAGLKSPFVVRRPAELRDALQCRAEEISALAKRVRGRPHPRRSPVSERGPLPQVCSRCPPTSRVENTA